MAATALGEGAEAGDFPIARLVSRAIARNFAAGLSPGGGYLPAASREGRRRGHRRFRWELRPTSAPYAAFPLLSVPRTPFPFALCPFHPHGAPKGGVADSPLPGVLAGPTSSHIYHIYACLSDFRGRGAAFSGVFFL